MRSSCFLAKVALWKTSDPLPGSRPFPVRPGKDGAPSYLEELAAKRPG